MKKATLFLLCMGMVLPLTAHLIPRKYNEEATRKLQKKISNVNVTEVNSSFLKSIEKFLQEDADPNVKPIKKEEMYTKPLMHILTFAPYYKELIDIDFELLERVLKTALKAGADPNAIENEGRDVTPLFYAVVKGSPNMVQMLLDYGADPHKKDKQGQDIADFVKGRLDYYKKEVQNYKLDIINSENRLKMVKKIPKLVESHKKRKDGPKNKKSDFNYNATETEQLRAKIEAADLHKSPLAQKIFADSEFLNDIKKLIENGADPSIKLVFKTKDKFDRDYIDDVIIKMLVEAPEYKPDIDFPLLEDVIAVALKHGAKANVTDHGKPIVFEAVESGTLRMIELLLDYGAETEYAKEDGEKRTITDSANFFFEWLPTKIQKLKNKELPRDEQEAVHFQKMFSIIESHDNAATKQQPVLIK